MSLEQITNTGISEITAETISTTTLADFQDAADVEVEESDDVQMSDIDSDEDEEENDTNSDREEEEKKEFHDLFLPADTTASQQPIIFSGGMTYHQCQEYYRALELEEARRSCKRRRHQFFFGRVSGRSNKSAKTVEFDMDASEEAQLVDAIAVSAPPGKAIRRGSDESVASTASTSSCSSSSFSETTSTSISFDETVTVYPVPAIEDYPEDCWNATWKPRAEVRAHKKRSKKEYAWDGYDWENATEEDDMIRDPETGLLEHPSHYESYHSLAGSTSRGPIFSFRLGMSR